VDNLGQGGQYPDVWEGARTSAVREIEVTSPIIAHAELSIWVDLLSLNWVRCDDLSPSLDHFSHASSGVKDAASFDPLIGTMAANCTRRNAHTSYRTRTQSRKRRLHFISGFVVESEVAILVDHFGIPRFGFEKNQRETAETRKFLTFLYSDDVEDNRAGDQVWEHCGPRMPRGKDVEVLTQGFDFVVFLQLTIACSKRVS